MESTVEMIDLHCHILTGLDDGPETMEESLRMCRIACDDGIGTVVATPHTLNGVYQNGRLTTLNRLEELNSELRTYHSELHLTILPGADVHLCEATLHQIDRGEVITIGDTGKFIMIEFPFQGVPFRSEQILFQLLARGMTPIISHPERNVEIRERPGRYAEMIRMGCFGQVTAMSLTGGFGPKVKQGAERLLRSRLVHLIATDAHSENGRPPILSAAVKAAARVIGKEEAMRMVTEYPQAVLNGRRPDIPEPISF